MNNKNIIKNRTNKLGVIAVVIAATVMIAGAGIITSLGEYDAVAKGYLSKLQDRSNEQVEKNIPSDQAIAANPDGSDESNEQVEKNIPSDQAIAANPDGSDEAPAPGQKSCLHNTINPFPCTFVTANGYCGVEDGANGGESYEVDCKTRNAK